jgi:hypothetical protein
MRRLSRRGKLGLLVFGGIAMVILYHFLSGVGSLFTSPPPVKYLSVNVTYWLFSASGLLSLTSTSVFWFVFLASIPLMLWLHRLPWACRIFSGLLACYVMTFNALAGHHYHSMVGALALTIPFWFSREKSFNLAFAAVRFYACFFFASSALWKIGRGSVFHHGHIANLIQSDYAGLLAAHPDSTVARLLFFMSDNPWIGDVLFAVVALLQLSFVVGFFTGKFDALLLIFLGMLILGNYVFFHVASWEVLIFGVCFLPKRWMASGSEQQRSHPAAPESG